uniref:Sulfotransferase n=1 Tax=Hippocampus comes TaxID=109280 RepID=A0A3Q2Z440_HIPCM
MLLLALRLWLASLPSTCFESILSGIFHRTCAYWGLVAGHLKTNKVSRSQVEIQTAPQNGVSIHSSIVLPSLESLEWIGWIGERNISVPSHVPYQGKPLSHSIWNKLTGAEIFRILAWGYWHDHVKGFWEEQEKRDILYLFYEDMKENPRREVERIMKYLDLSLSDDDIGHIVELTTFKNMKENPMTNFSFFPPEIYNQSISKFMRKGEVGDWKNHFTPEQSAAFDEDYEKKMKQANIPFKTEL